MIVWKCHYHIPAASGGAFDELDILQPRAAWDVAARMQAALLECITRGRPHLARFRGFGRWPPFLRHGALLPSGSMEHRVRRSSTLPSIDPLL